MGEKGHSYLGEAEFDMTQFGQPDYRIHILALKNCADPTAFISVGLKASGADSKSSTPSDRRGTKTPQGKG